MSLQNPEKPDDGTLPIVLKIFAVFCIVGSLVGASEAGGVGAGFSFTIFVSGIFYAVLLWSVAAIITALRHIEHHTRPRTPHSHAGQNPTDAGQAT